MALEKANSHIYLSDDDRWSSCETHLVASTSTLFLDFVCRVCSHFNRWNTTKNLCYKFQQGFNSYYITPLNLRVLCAVCVSLSLCVYVCAHAPCVCLFARASVFLGFSYWGREGAERASKERGRRKKDYEKKEKGDEGTDSICYWSGRKDERKVGRTRGKLEGIRKRGRNKGCKEEKLEGRKKGINKERNKSWK